ncbi:MAG: hypothetical protein AAB214_00725 [Fibrobacterota bacterium]
MRIKPLIHLAPLALAACVDTAQDLSTAPAHGEETMVVDRSSDFRVVVPVSKADAAGRVAPYYNNANRWSANQAITVSVFTSTTYNGGVDPITSNPLATPPDIFTTTLDTALRAWNSLINPDGPNPVAFKLVGANNSTAKVKVFFNHAEGEGANFGLVMHPYAVSNFTSAIVSVYNVHDEHILTDNQAALYHALVHLMGHVLNVGDNPTTDDDVMSSVGYAWPDGTPSSIAKKRFFSQNSTIETVNYLYNGGMDNNTPYAPVFTIASDESWGNQPVVGWDNAKKAVEAGKYIILRGIVGKAGQALVPAANSVSLFNNGSYWTSSIPGNVGSGMPSYCQDSPKATALLGIQFQTLVSQPATRVMKMSSLNNHSTGSSNFQLNFDTQATGWACQLGMGYYYNLYGR